MKKYGKTVEGIEYGVVNERAVRATAGTMFLIGGLTFSYTFFTRDYQFVYLVVPLFWLDFLLKSVFDPRYSIFGKLGTFFVQNQKPEYVGAVQKRFAWSIGLALATVMMIFVLGFGVRGILPLIICTTCLFFMWMESALGICVGCKIYAWLLKVGVIKEPKVRPACPGGVCSVKR